MGATSRNAAKARRGAAGWLKRRALASSGQDVMTKDQKVIRAIPGGVSLSEVPASGVGRCLFSSGQRKARYFGAVRAIE